MSEYPIDRVALGLVIYADEIGNDGGFCCRNVNSSNISLFYLENGVSAAFDFESVEYLRLAFQIRETRLVVSEGREVIADPGGPGYVMPMNCPAREYRPNGHRSLALRVDPLASRRRLEALLGMEISGPLVFEQPTRSDARFVEYIRRPLIAAARELNHLEAPFLQSYMAELEALTLTRLLLHARHTHSHRLEVAPPRTSPDRLSLVEDYIRANWNRAIEMEELVSLANVSGRTLYRDCLERHGETPSRYIKRIRLTAARDMLKEASGHSVMSIALLCGFSSLGHFADAYRRMFGELPSTTARHD